MKRNLVEEIKEIKERVGSSEYHDRLTYGSRLDEIDYAMKGLVSTGYDKYVQSELMRYIPIATVACFEAFFRSIIKELIDNGEPYLSNAVNYNQSKNVKFDFEIVNAIRSKSISIGEFIAHILSFNNLDDIKSNMNVILNKDFLQELKNYKSKSSFPHEHEIRKEFQDNISQIFEYIKRMYEMRHIFCHEFASEINVNADEIFNMFKGCRVFMEHTNNFIWNILYPNAPETQTEMNIDSYDKYVRIEAELAAIVKEIRNSKKHHETSRFNVKRFDKTIELWKKYRDSVAELHSDSYKGGTIYPLIYNSALTEITKEKISSLKEEYKFIQFK